MRFVSGAAAGATATTLTYPLERSFWGSRWKLLGGGMMLVLQTKIIKKS